MVVVLKVAKKQDKSACEKNFLISYLLFVWDGRVRILIQIKEYYYNKEHCLYNIIQLCCLINTLALTLNN